MSHPSVLAFFSEALTALRPGIPDGARVLEIGSYDVNGSVRGTVVRSVAPRDYVGVDLTPGPGVDVVASGDEVDLPAGSFDLAISAECLEHNPRYRETLDNMRRMTRAGGFVLVSCAAPGRFEHGTVRTDPKSSPGTQATGWDYYRNLVAADFPAGFVSSFADHAFHANKHSHDLYFIGSTVSALPAELKKPLKCSAIRPRSTLVNRLTLDLPLEAFRLALPEERFQDAGVALIRLRKRLRQTFGARRRDAR